MPMARPRRALRPDPPFTEWTEVRPGRHGTTLRPAVQGELSQAPPLPNVGCTGVSSQGNQADFAIKDIFPQNWVRLTPVNGLGRRAGARGFEPRGARGRRP